MKILVITPTFLPIMGGAEKGIYEIFSRLAEKHEVKVLTPFPEKKFLDSFCIEENYKTNRMEILKFYDKINLLKLSGHWKLKGIIPPFSLSTLFKATKIVNSLKPDIVLCFYAIPTGLTAIFLYRFRKIPVILLLIGRDIPGPGIPHFWKNYSKLIVKAVKNVIFISEYCRNALGFKSNFGEIIPFGIDIEKFKPGLDKILTKKRLNIPEDAKILFSVQRLDKWKRVDILIKAMKIISENVNAYLVVGGKGPEMNSLIDLSKTLSLESRVIFTGYIKDDELPLFYSMADLFVFHSTYETLGLVWLEAMASGKPIVSVKSTAIPEAVEDGVNGILVEPLNPEEFARAVIDLLKDPERMRDFGIASREIAVRKYSLDEVVKRYEHTLFRI